MLCRYIADPLLVGGRKFHIRAYALCVGSLAAYVHSCPLALFAAAPYPQVVSSLDAVRVQLFVTELMCHKPLMRCV